MDEHRINIRGIKEGEEIYGGSEVGDPSGAGERWQRGGGGCEVPGSSPDIVSLEEVLGRRGERTPARHPTEKERGVEASGARESETQRGAGITEPGVDAFKKRDELGLSGRRLGSRVTDYQREGIRRVVEEYLGQGIAIMSTLGALVS